MASKYIFVDSINTVILTDYVYWFKQDDKLKLWCEKHQAEFKGMLVRFKNKSDASLFCLEF